MEATTLARRARSADAAVQRGRLMLVHAVREAHADGMSQRQIARAIGRSQPEVNRLLRFHGDSPAGLALRKSLPQIRELLAENGLTDPRVFGSTATGDDGPDSDIDLLVTASTPLSLMSLSRVEHQLSLVIGRQVDLVLDTALRPDLSDQILASAVRL